MTISDGNNMVFVSAVVIWEIRIKQALGKLEIPPDFRQVLDLQPFEMLAITVEHAHAVADIPAIHRDPFDRMLVAQANVEKAVGPKSDHAGVVVLCRLLEGQQDGFAVCVGSVRIVARSKADDARVTVTIREVHEEEPVVRVIGMEGQAEQAALGAAARAWIEDLRAQVEEGLGQERVVHENPDAPALLDDEKARRVARRLDEIERLVQVRDERGRLEGLAGAPADQDKREEKRDGGAPPDFSFGSDEIIQE